MFNDRSVVVQGQLEHTLSCLLSYNSCFQPLIIFISLDPFLFDYTQHTKMTYSKAQEISLAISPICAGCVSFTSSSTIATMILRSKTKLTKPYRRIVFGMCLYDIIQSLGAMSSTFLSPEDSDRLWAFGNDSSCSAQGFIHQVSGRDYVNINKISKTCQMCQFF